MVVVLAALVGVLVLLGRYVLEDPTCAKPPTQQERTQQEAFVRTHLPDARDFEWTVMDCDDNGQASVDFTTRQRGSAASKAFLSDPACRASVEPDASPGDVTCTSGDFEVSIYLEDKGAIDTYGELALLQR